MARGGEGVGFWGMVGGEEDDVVEEEGETEVPDGGEGGGARVDLVLCAPEGKVSSATEWGRFSAPCT